MSGIEFDGGWDTTSTAIGLSNVGSLSLRDMVVTRTGNGLVSNASVIVTITGSAFVSNPDAAIQLISGGESPLARVVIAGNGTGFNASGTTQVVDCTFASQTNGAFRQFNGTGFAFGDICASSPNDSGCHLIQEQIP